jgi:hypothetical protein
VCLIAEAFARYPESNAPERVRQWTTILVKLRSPHLLLFSARHCGLVFELAKALAAAIRSETQIGPQTTFGFQFWTRPMENAFRHWLYSGLYRGDMRGLRTLAYREIESADIVKRLTARGFIRCRRHGLPRVTAKGYAALLAHRLLSN